MQRERQTIAKNRDLSRTTADIDVQRRRSARAATLRRSQPDQTCFFDSGKYFYFDSSLLLDGLDKVGVVVGFTNCRGCGGNDQFRATPFRNRSKTSNTISGAQDRVASEIAFD